jgi:hypothetical protein
MGIDLTTPWGAVINAAVGIIDKVIPDPAQKAAAQLQILQLQQTGELDQLKAQVDLALSQQDVNKIEAASPSFFKSGWRPFVGWVCASGLAVQFLVAPIGVWMAGLMGHPTQFPNLDLGTLMTLLFGMLGLGAMRSYDKKAGTA